MSTSANTTTETHEVEKGIFLTIKKMNQQTTEGDPVTVHVFTVSSNILLELVVYCCLYYRLIIKSSLSSTLLLTSLVLRIL
jgi:hypothetical protein